MSDTLIGPGKACDYCGQDYGDHTKDCPRPIDLGFRSGDYVRCGLRSFENKPYPEAQLICPMRPDDSDRDNIRMLWWASNCAFAVDPLAPFPVIIVSCGPKGWVLNETRDVVRDGHWWQWDKKWIKKS